MMFPAFGFRFGFAERVCTKHLLRLNRLGPEATALKVADFKKAGGTRNLFVPSYRPIHKKGSRPVIFRLG